MAFTHSLTVTNANASGCSATAQASLTVNAPPTASLTNNGPLTCLTTSVTPDRQWRQHR